MPVMAIITKSFECCQESLTGYVFCNLDISNPAKKVAKNSINIEIVKIAKFFRDLSSCFD